MRLGGLLIDILIAGLVGASGGTGVVLAGAGRAPDQASGPGVQGDALFAGAHFAAAASAYRFALRSDPHNANAELGLARISLYRNDLANAERYARAFTRDAPTDRRARGLLKIIADRRDDGPDNRASISRGEVEIPFERIDPLPQFKALVNGKLANFSIDTGSPGLSLSRDFARALGVTTYETGERVFAGGLRGEVRFGHVDRLDLGDASIRSIAAAIPPEMPPGIDGVIGTNVLYRFLATIDYAKHRLVLRPKAASRAFEEVAGHRNAVILPLLLLSDPVFVPMATARVNNAPAALFLIDTGGPGIGVDVTKHELAAAAIVPDASHPSFFRGPGGGVTRTLSFTADVTLDNRTFRDLPGVYLPQGDPRRMLPFAVGGTLSHDLFKRGTLTFDFSAMKLVFEAAR